MKKTEKTERRCIIANKSYGLYVGIVESVSAPGEDGTRVVEAREVRHIARWHGKTGGITSLAVHGLCGPSAGESRIGAAVARASLGGVVNLFDCTAEAWASLEAAKQS